MQDGIPHQIRIVDASTMSLAITRKSNTTVTMMAEKISGHILNKTLLPQSDVKFYKAVLWA